MQPRSHDPEQPTASHRMLRMGLVAHLSIFVALTAGFWLLDAFAIAQTEIALIMALAWSPVVVVHLALYGLHTRRAG